MIRRILLLIACVTGSLLRGARRILMGVSGLLIVALLGLNLAMVAIPAVYNILSTMMWSTVSVLSEGYAVRNATTAKSKAKIDADANRRRELEAERKRLQAGNAEVEARLGRAESELEEVKRREQKAAQELVEVRRQNSLNLRRAQKAEAELSRAALESRQSRRVAGETLFRMQQRSLRMVSRNTATVFTDALPLIGTVTIVGGVAWDVWDTCAQLDDLRSIGDTLELPESGEGQVEKKWCGLSRDEVFALLFQAPPNKEFLCVQARLRTGSLDPPECADFPINLVDFADPLNQPQVSPPSLPPMNYE